MLAAWVASLASGDPLPDYVHGVRALSGNFIAILACAALIAATYSRLGHERVQTLGLAFEVLLCAVISIYNPLGLYQDSGTIPRLTWVSPIIIMFPLIIPTRPSRALVTSLLAAATAPLGLLALRAAGKITFTSDPLAANIVSPLIAVVFAFVASRVVYGLGLDLSKARRIGSYELEERLGAGGMGEVWKARHRMLARPAAVKLIRPEVLGAADEAHRALARERFEREAQATALMRSPHTIEVYDFGVSAEGTFYYVMELLDGFTVDTLVERFGPVEAGRAVHLLRQTCDSLAEAHEHGLIHRDVKPANLFVCRYGRRDDFVKVLDFGLVKAPGTEGGADPRLTGEGMAAGTPATMSPEQILGRAVDGRADIYGMGCVAYWLLTGRPVFEGTSSMEILTHHVHTPPAPPSRVTEIAVPPELDALVLSCLEKEPGKRPQTADDLDAALASIPLESLWTPERSRRWWDDHHQER
jgi:serine/threonine-protein kinase